MHMISLRNRYFQIQTVLLTHAIDLKIQFAKLIEDYGRRTALTMARKNPNAYAGLILYAPMISLEKVRQQELALGIKNAHIEVLAGILSLLLPSVPIAKPARNSVHPKAQDEFDLDPLCYHGGIRNRVAEQFLSVSSELLSGGLQDVRTPFITYHSCRDTFTDPHGSERLLSEASVSEADKTYIRVGKGLDIDVNIWQ